MADMARDALAVLDEAGVDGARDRRLDGRHDRSAHRARPPRAGASLVLACTTPGGRSGPPPWRLLVASALRPLFGSRRTFPLVAPVLYAAESRATGRSACARTSSAGSPDNTPALTIYAQMGAIAGHDTHGGSASLPDCRPWSCTGSRTR